MAAPVATLEIQLVADILRLQKDMRAAQGAIDGMTNGATTGFVKAGRAASDMARAAQQSAAGMNTASGAGKVMAQQLSQVAQQGMATGNYLQALAIQLPDIAVGMGAAGASAGRFATFLGGPWGIALASATALLVPLIGKLFETADAADTARNALTTLMQQRQRELQQQSAISSSTKTLNADLARRNELEAEIARRGVRGANGQLMFVYKQQQELKELNQRIYETRDAIDSQRLGAGSLNKVLDALANQNIKVEGATKRVTSAGARHSAGMRAAKKDADDFTLSLQAVAQALGAYQNGSLDALKAQMDAIEDASEAAFSRLLAEDNGRRTKWLTDAADANQRWNERLEKTVQLVDQIGGAAFGGAWSNLRTPLSQIAGMSVVKIDPNSGKELSVTLGRVFSDSLDKVFGGEGSFLKMLQGAATGGSIGALFGTPGSQLGGTIGGAFGEKFGEKFLQGGLNKIMKGLGDFAGPIGSILGGLAGGLLGKLFKGGPDWATTNLSTGASGGNKDQQRTGVSQAVGAFDQALQQIATSLGASVGNFNTSIGLHNGNWHVSTDGRTGVLRSSQANVRDFKGDSQAALEYAIQDAISDGVFKGLSAGVERLLKGEGDLDTKLQKALSFQSVFDELEQLRDPQAYDLKGLDKWRAGMDAIFAEAGATADELAKLEELTGLKRKEIVEKYATDTLELERQARQMDAEIARLQGDDIRATAIARELEREQIDETLRARYDLIASLQDEAAAAQRVLSLQVRLSRAQGNDATAQAIERMQELNAAQTEQERSMLRSIYAAEDLTAKQDAASSAMQSFADMIQSVADAAYKASAELRAYANEIFDDATRSDPAVLLSQIQAAMKAGNTAVLPELLKAYQPLLENQSGSRVDELRQLAYLRQGSLYTADYADARANQSANAMSWYMRQMAETGGQGNWSATMPDGYYEDQANYGAVTADKLGKVESLLEQMLRQQARLGAEQIVELQGQTSTIDNAFNGGAGVVVLEPAA